MFIAYFKKVLRDRTFVFWSMMFPICLMICFKLAFGNLYDEYKSFDPTKAVYVNNSGSNLNDVVLKMLGQIGLEDAYDIFQLESLFDLVESGDYDALEEFEVDEKLVEEYVQSKIETGSFDENSLGISDEVWDEFNSLIYAMTFTEALKTLGEEGDKQCFDIYECSSVEEAERLLEDGERHVLFIIENGSVKVELSKNYSDVDLIITNGFMSSFDSQYSITMEQLKLQDMSFGEEVASRTYIKALENIYGEEPDPYNWYYYSTFVMGIMFNIIMGVGIVGDIQADITKSAMRVSVSATSKIQILLAAFTARLVLLLGCEAVQLVVMRFVFDIPIGNRLGLLILFVVIADIFTLSLGELFGIFIKGSISKKENISNALLMISVFFSGEMMATLPGTFAEKCPIINEINPATIMNFAFYKLVYYENLNGFYINLVKLSVAAVVFLTISVMKLRRQRYASL